MATQKVKYQTSVYDLLERLKPILKAKLSNYSTCSSEAQSRLTSCLCDLYLGTVEENQLNVNVTLTNTSHNAKGTYIVANIYIKTVPYSYKIVAAFSNGYLSHIKEIAVNGKSSKLGLNELLLPMTLEHLNNLSINELVKQN